MIDPSAHEPRPERVAGHYLVQERLGAGGMAVVDRVVDERTGEELALKRLTRSGQVVEALFEREYQILSELAHPRIVRVHEYGLDDAGKYYTMELLKGEELLGRLPMPWQNVCVVLRDVLSALALVHSRRLLHRDVTARNVHLGPDGRAKLMDFGSVVNMGLVEGVVGTPPHIAPEAFLEQPLDARTDLYSLGALAYQALTGHHAYPAHHTGQLRAVWHRPLRPPAQLVEAIPEDLNRLVLSLLSLDRLARPASAADVMERLTSIAGLPLDESPAVARCYLTTPTLTGRDSELVRVRQALLRAVRGRGGAIAYVGTDGVGRSRMLAACRLEAKLLGAASIHVTGSSEHPFATFRQLLTATLDQWPELNRQATELQLLQSMLAGTHPQPATLEPERVVEAFLELLQAAARTGCLVVTIDDLHHCDPESTFVFVHLARRAHGMALLVGAAGDTSIRSGSMEQLFVREARLEHLELLDLDQTHTLLGSLFGDAQHLKLATDWAYGVSKGNPGRIVQLAQHLLDTGVARYEKGCWTLPRDFKRLPLPRSIAETLAVQLDRLRSDAKTIATGLALCLENYPLPAQYQGLLLTESHESIEQRLATRRALDELVALEILRSRDGPARFAHAVVREALVDRLQPAARRALHARLAAAFRQDENAGQLVVAYHLAESGDESTALELALEYLKTSGDKRDNVNRDFALEAKLLERLLGVARRIGCPRAVTLPILVMLMGLAHRIDRRLARHFPEAVAEARIDIGLGHYAEIDAQLGDSCSADDKLLACLARQRAIWQATPEHERGVTTEQATDALARSTHRMAAVCLETLDADAVDGLPAEIEPIASLSPALKGIHELAEIIRNHVLGLPHENWRIALTDRWREPVVGLPDGARLGTVHICAAYNAWYFSEIGSTQGLEIAEELECLPAYEVLAWDVRLGVALYQADAAGASAARERRDMASAQRHGSLKGHCAGSAYHEVRAHALSGDVLGLRQSLEAVDHNARFFSSWQHIKHWAHAEYHRLRGDTEEARQELERALSLAQAGRHRLWCWIASCYIEVLLELQELEASVKFAHHALERCESHGLSATFTRAVRSSAALALAHGGASARALELADEVVKELSAAGGGGLPLARFLENRTRVLSLVGNEGDYRHDLLGAIRRLGALCQTLGSGALAARYEGLARELVPGELTGLSVPGQRAQEVASQLEQAGPGGRWERALQILLEEVHAEEGALYSVTPDGVAHMASRGLPGEPGLVQALTQFMQAELAEPPDVTVTVADLGLLAGDGRETYHWTSGTGQDLYFRPLRFVCDSGCWISGVLVVAAVHACHSPATEVEAVVATSLAEVTQLGPVQSAM